MPTVDVHSHFVPPEAVAAARAGTGFDGMRIERRGAEEWLVHRQGFAYPLPRSFYEVQERLAAMDRYGIDRTVLSVAPPLFMYWADPSETVDFCREVNDGIARFSRDSGGRIAAVATLPMQQPDAAEAELRRAVRELGLRGAEIGPTAGELPLDDPSVRPVLAAAAQLEVPLIVHPYYVGPLDGLSDFYLTNLIGNPLASTVCAARLILSGLLDELPDLQLVLVHGGGYLPYQIGRLDHGRRVRPEARGARHEPSHYLRRFWFDTVLHAAPPLRMLVDLVGPDRVVYGTDFPYDMAAGSPADQLDALHLAPADRQLVAGGNAVALFGLTGREVTG